MKCLILDDEPGAHQVLEHYISETPGMELTAQFRNSIEAFEYLGKNRVDILFLDIEMPLITGINFLKALPEAPKTIFTTAYKQYAFDGFELEAVDYLLKPFSYERFIKAVNKVLSLNKPMQEVSDYLVVKEKDRLLNLRQQDIIYIEGCKDYIKLITVDKTHIIYHTLKGILKKLNRSLFTQSHRSYLVNKTHVLRIYQDTLILSNQTFIPIGKLYRKQLMAHVGS